MQEEYKEHEIVWNDFRRKFEIKKDGETIKDVLSVEEAEKWIDVKCKQKFKRIPILYKERYGSSPGWAPGEATSLIDSDYAWIIIGKNRSKAQIENIRLDTPDNRDKAETIKLTRATIKRLDSEIEEMEASMERLTQDIMIIKEAV